MIFLRSQQAQSKVLNVSFYKLQVPVIYGRMSWLNNYCFLVNQPHYFTDLKFHFVSIVAVYESPVNIVLILSKYRPRFQITS